MEILEIETDRLRLRRLAIEDLDAIHCIWTEPEVRKYLWDDESISRERARSVLTDNVECFDRHGFGIWAIISKESRDLTGFCGFRFVDGTDDIELLYGLTAPYWAWVYLPRRPGRRSNTASRRLGSTAS